MEEKDKQEVIDYMKKKDEQRNREIIILAVGVLCGIILSTIFYVWFVSHLANGWI